MAARQTLQLSSSSLKTFLSSSASNLASKASKLTGLASSAKPTPASLPKSKFSSTRLPVELGSLQSLMPLHSATASALSTSLLSLHNSNWGCLSEGFATTL